MFTSRYVKHSKLLLRHAQKYLRYKRDVLDAETYDAVARIFGDFMPRCANTTENRLKVALKSWMRNSTSSRR